MLPVVSVIIPARNEELCIGACLESLVAQAAGFAPANAEAPEYSVLVTPDGLAYQIIVIDDDSTDRTSAIAHSFNRVCVIAADPLLPGWTGKSNACATGARRVRGSWLLFTDADTVHKPESLSRSLAEARFHHADLLSYSPQQEVTGLGQRAVMPLIFAELACTYRPREVCDPCSPVAAANGQFLLISREAYDAIGGHASVAGDVLEDVALARLVKQSGRRLRFRYGGDMVRTRMYRSFAQMHEGWTKNLALLFPSPAQLAAFRAFEFGAIWGGAVAALLTFSKGKFLTSATAAVVSIAASANVIRRVRKAHFGTFSTLFSLFGLPFFSYLLLRSRISHKQGRVAWKGREYRSLAETRPQAVTKQRLRG